MTDLILLRDWQKSQVEFWKPILGFDGYDVSNFGRVRAWHTRCGRPSKTWRLMTSHPDRGGYLQLTMTNSNHRRQSVKVHQLVARAFINNPSGRREVNHKTAYKLDCRSDNLEWSTRLLNIRHSFEHGLVPRANGERHPMAILTDRQAKEILARVRNGERGSDLAVEFGVTKYVISDIKTGKSWKHLQLGEN